MSGTGYPCRPEAVKLPKLLLQCCLAALVLLLAVDSRAAEPIAHTVIADGHPLTLWSKEVDHPRAQVVLLHGRTWSSLPDFDLQVEGESLSFMDGLNELGYNAWALDARGYGATPRDASGWITPNRAAADVEAVLRWLASQEGSDIHLFGWSYGSMVAQLVAQQNSDLIRSVILFGYPLSPAYKLSPPVINPEPTRITNTAENAASDFITPGSISITAVNAYVAQSLAADPVRADWRDLEQWLQLDASKLDIPTLLLQAEFDPLAHSETHARMFLLIPHSDKQWTVIAGGDHAALLEKPRQKMLHTIGAFIKGLDQ